MVLKQFISADNKSKFESFITDAGDNTIQLKDSQEDKKQLIINQTEKFWLLCNSFNSWFFLWVNWSMASMYMKFPCAYNNWISKIMSQYTKLEHTQQVHEMIANLHKFILKLIYYERIHWEMNINNVTHLLAKLNLN